jgi:peroxiredoxin
VWERIYKELKVARKNVEFVGVAVADGETRSRSFVDRHKLSFPNVYDGDGRVARSFGFLGQPYSAWIDAHGNVIRQGFGPVEESAFRAMLARIVR